MISRFNNTVETTVSDKNLYSRVSQQVILRDPGHQSDPSVVTGTDLCVLNFPDHTQTVSSVSERVAKPPDNFGHGEVEVAAERYEYYTILRCRHEVFQITWKSLSRLSSHDVTDGQCIWHLWKSVADGYVFQKEPQRHLQQMLN